MASLLAIDLGASSGRVIRVTCDTAMHMQQLHRFENRPLQQNGRLCWDIDALEQNILTGLRLAAQTGGFDAIGIDTWGVDFCMIDADGRLLQLPTHYRDERHATAVDPVHRQLPWQALYCRTGIQPLPFNTVYQLAWMVEHQPELLAQADRILPIADYLAYRLCGQAVSEMTMASTTALMDCATKRWDDALCSRLGIPARLLPPLCSNLTVRGILRDELAAELGCPPKPVVCVGGHDTASAVAGCPGERPLCYISCGTWSIMGTEVDAPVLQDDSFSNETGVGGTTRLLKNIMGMWLLQEVRRAWQQAGETVEFAEMTAMAQAAAPTRAIIDPDYPWFSAPGDMPGRIAAYLQQTNQPPVDRPALLACLHQSLALKHRVVFEQLCQLCGRQFPAIHMVGGGTQNALLCQLTADACQVPVIAGPVEATVLGNAAAQAVAIGAMPDLPAAQAAIAAGFPPQQYLPRSNPHLESLYADFAALCRAGTAQ